MAEPFAHAADALRRVTGSLGTKLFIAIFAVLLVSLGVLGYLTVTMQRRNIEAARLASGQQLSNFIKQSTSYSMLNNDREALRYIVDSLASQPGVATLRVRDARERVAFSSRTGEVGTVIPLRLPVRQPSEGRIYSQSGQRFLGITTPILNSPTCATAACHAHPSSQRVLGTLEVDLSLAAADADVRKITSRFTLASALIILLTIGVTALVVFRLVDKPVKALQAGTEQLSRGELGAQIPVHSGDELGRLATSFNQMSRQLAEARVEITAWTRELEERVRRRTAELEGAQHQMIQAEKLSSLGKLAAVVAHEINNPLSAILTYARLMRKWVDRGDALEQHSGEMHDSLALIESESRRCGEIVRNLLVFARVSPLNIAPVDVNATIQQTIKLVDHKLDLGNITLTLDLQPDVPPLQGDRGQIEQLLLALVMNAIEAMPGEGNLRLTSRRAGDEAVITVEDDGVGIPPSVLSKLFDPFVTTKEEGKGVGLGLAISRGIVDRHHGRITVDSQVGKGTKFTIMLPLAPVPKQEVREAPAMAAV